MIEPGWSLRFAEHATGTEIIGLDPSKRIGLSIQPFFAKETSLPIMVIIANYLPLGMIPPITHKLRNQMQSLAQKEIGEANP